MIQTFAAENPFNLEDNTIIEDNTCITEENNFKIVTYPCNVQDFDGKDITQYITFNWDGHLNISGDFIFVYTKNLEKGEVYMEDTREVQQLRFRDITATQNYLYENLENVEINGNIATITDDNYTFNIEFNEYTKIDDSTYYFNTTLIRSEAYNITLNQTYYKDITNKFRLYGENLFGNGLKYYIVEGVVFNPNKTIKTKWVYTPKGKNGKWHIFGKPSALTFIQAINQGKYIYQDPWWNNNWEFKRNIVINTTDYLDNYSMSFNISYDSDMNTDFSDLRFVQDDELLNYYIENFTERMNAFIRVRLNLSGSNTSDIEMYYGNPNATSLSDINGVYLFYDNFSSANSSEWDYCVSTDNANLNYCDNAVLDGYLRIRSTAYRKGTMAATTIKNIPFKNISMESRYYNTENYYRNNLLGVHIHPDILTAQSDTEYLTTNFKTNHIFTYGLSSISYMYPNYYYNYNTNYYVSSVGVWKSWVLYNNGTTQTLTVEGTTQSGGISSAILTGVDTHNHTNNKGYLYMYITDDYGAGSGDAGYRLDWIKASLYLSTIPSYNVSLVEEKLLVILNESEAKNFILTEIDSELSNANIYYDRQVYTYDGSHHISTFDILVEYGDQYWAFNYISGNESYSNMSSMGTTLNVWENSSLNEVEIADQIESFITSTIK